MSEDLKPIVGQGHPLDPDRHKILSEDDEKRVDEKGKPVAEGKLWSKSHSGMYLVIALSTAVIASDKIMTGQTEIDLGPEFKAPGFKLHIMVSPYGKPTFAIPVVGACLELPDDLGQDKLKRQYVIEWIIHTTVEALADRNLSLKGLTKGTLEEFMMAVATGSERAIASTRM